MQISKLCIFSGHPNIHISNVRQKLKIEKFRNTQKENIFVSKYLNIFIVMEPLDFRLEINLSTGADDVKGVLYNYAIISLK